MQVWATQTHVGVWGLLSFVNKQTEYWPHLCPHTSIILMCTPETIEHVITTSLLFLSTNRCSLCCQCMPLIKDVFMHTPLSSYTPFLFMVLAVSSGVANFPAESNNAHTHAHTHSRTHSHSHTHTRACTGTHTHTLSHIHTCTHINTHAHTHSLTYTHIHTYVRRSGRCDVWPQVIKRSVL
jgi:hypothetical protein